MAFDWTAAAIVGATLLGPILAVEIQKRLEEGREATRRKETLFRTLMTTRSVRVSQQHVEALNAIDLTFEGGGKDEEVRTAWKAYLDILNTPFDQRNEAAKNIEHDNKFIDVLYAMSQALGRKYDRTYLKNSWYRPQAHVDLETTTLQISKLFLEILENKRSFPVSTTNSTY